MGRLSLIVLAVLLTGSAQAQTVIQYPPVVVTPPPIVVAPPPVVVAPPPVVVAPPPPPPPPVCVVNLPPWEWLNLRTYPNGWIIGPMPPGTPLTLLGQFSGRWGFVQTPIGTGWAFLPYTTCN